MDGFIVAGLMIVLTMIVMMFRSNIKRWLGYANIVDIAFTIIMLYLFHGTFSGVVSASFAGVIMSLTLSALRASLGYEKLKIVRTKWYKGYVRLEWVSYPGGTRAKEWFRNTIMSIRLRMAYNSSAPGY